MNEISTNNGRAYVPVDDARWQRFLDGLRATGSFSAAARMASPHGHGSRAGVSTFRAVMDRDPAKAEEADAAMAEFLDSVESEIIRRGRDGYMEPTIYKGRLQYEEGPDGKPRPVTVRKYSDALLLALARARLPDRYASQTTITHRGEVQHRHAHCLVLDPTHIHKLSLAQVEQLQSLLAILRPEDFGEREVEAQDAFMEAARIESHDESDDEILRELGEGVEDA